MDPYQAGDQVLGLSASTWRAVASIVAGSVGAILVFCWRRYAQRRSKR